MGCAPNSKIEESSKYVSRMPRRWCIGFTTKSSCLLLTTGFVVRQIRARGANSKCPECASFTESPVSFCASPECLQVFCSNEHQKRPWEGQEAVLRRAITKRCHPAMPSNHNITSVDALVNCHRVTQSTTFIVEKSELLSQLCPSLSI